ncbi:MAG: TetR/AcrR family transcriptional regulator [Candidatus Eremiobacteraeota bacterium]|nr:TetR/AcrR family transcriptional regulator [Candidatus Eremiobacteraeota bacterium]
MTDTGERLGASCAGERDVLAAAIADPATPDYAVVRALAALGGESNERLARFTGMGREFVVEVRRRAACDGAAAVLAGAPSVCERILESATEQIVASGRRDVEMRALCAAARVPRRTLYNLYSSSTDLVQTCQRRAQTIWRARFEQRVVRSSTDARGRLFAVVDAIDAWVGSTRFRADLLLVARPSLASELRDDDLREHLAEIERFATALAADARVRGPHAFGAFVATSVAGASAWFDRRAAARTASVAFVERSTGLVR